MDGPINGWPENHTDSPIAGTEDDWLYQTCRSDVFAYRLNIPNGTYRVRLRFCESIVNAVAGRVFGVKLQGKTVIDKLDIFAKVGRFTALDYTFDDIAVVDGHFSLDFDYEKWISCISGIAVEGTTAATDQQPARPFTCRINCGGPTHGDYQADLTNKLSATRENPRGLPSDDFYDDWASSMFGAEVADRAASIFKKIDGRLPRTSKWGPIDAAGAVLPNDRPWGEVVGEFAFVDEFETLRPHVTGPGNIERFDYWLSTFRYHRSQARVGCAFAALDDAVQKVEEEGKPENRKPLAENLTLPRYKHLLECMEEAGRYQLAAVCTYGDIGTFINWEQQIRPLLVDKCVRQFQTLGIRVPAELEPSRKYLGPVRLIVPTVRTSVSKGEPLKLKVMVLSQEPPTGAVLYWRPLGKGEFLALPMDHVARGVYHVTISNADDDLEYYVQVTMNQNDTTSWPATAPDMNQTVLVLPAP